MVGDMVVSGKVLPAATSERSSDEARRQLALRRRNLALLADSFFADGFVPVIDDVVVSEDVLDLYRSRILSRPLVFVMLLPRLDIIEARDGGRTKHFFHAWKHLDVQVREHMPKSGLWVDSSDLTANGTVDLILQRAGEGLLND